MTQLYKVSKIVLFFLMCVNLQILADDQNDYFIYDDDEQTIIVGVNESAWSQESLTIPSTVTEVQEGAFWGCSHLQSLYIDGGDPVFASGSLDDVLDQLEYLNLGSGMSVDNIRTLMMRLGEDHLVNTIEIDGYVDPDDDGIHFTTSTLKSILTEDVAVNLPAALVSDQEFGDAEVYGKFTLNGELGTFCGNATFYDESQDAQFLFYIPTEMRSETKEIYIKRVKYVVAGEGVLMHHIENTSSTVYLKRVNTTITYNDNMLVGVTEPTTIGKTDGNKTNMVLYQGKFHPTSGGTLGANRAYLQVPTEDLKSMGANAALSPFIVEDVIDGTENMKLIEVTDAESDEWFTLSGQRLTTRPVKSGIYLNGSKKVVIRK